MRVNIARGVTAMVAVRTGFHYHVPLHEWFSASVAEGMIAFSRPEHVAVEALHRENSSIASRIRLMLRQSGVGSLMAR